MEGEKREGEREERGKRGKRVKGVKGEEGREGGREESFINERSLVLQRVDFFLCWFDRV